MAKINYRRAKTWKIRIPIGKPTKIIEPDSLYNRDKEKEKWQREIQKYK